MKNNGPFLTKKSLALIGSFVYMSNMLSGVASATSDAQLVEDCKNVCIPNISIHQIDTEEFQKKAITDNYGMPTMSQVLCAIVEDARWPCLGGLRCQVITPSESDKLSIESRFESLKLDTHKVGNFAITISGNPNKARILAVIENKGSDDSYVRYVLNSFKEVKRLEMEEKGLEYEAAIANNAIIEFEVK